MTKKGINNPALVAATVAATPAGQQVITKAAESAASTVKVIKNVIIISLFAGITYWGVRKIFFGFKKLKEDKRFKATISEVVALKKADNIFSALNGINSFSTVRNELLRLNPNDFVRIYNEFGERKPRVLGISIPFQDKKNMIEWFGTLSNNQINELHFMFPDFI